MFSKIYLEITSLCNLACDFCPPTLRRGEFLSLERFSFILDRIQGFGTHLYFHLKGEPLLHPLLKDFLALAGVRGFKVTLTTNGTLVHKTSEVLLDSPGLKQLNISLHSHLKSNNLLSYWHSLEFFLDRHREAPKFPVSLRLWSRIGGKLPAQTKDFWSLLAGRYPALGPWKDGANWDKGIKLGERVYLNQEEEFTWPSLSLPQKNNRGFCHGLRNQIGILVDGRVVPCCLDGEGIITLGNLLDQNLGEILQSPRAQALYQGFTQRSLVEPLCRTCGFRERFAQEGE